MTINRRTFILRIASGAAAAALANILPLSSTSQEPTSLPDPLTEVVATGSNGNCVVFKIDGWDRCDDIAIGCSKIALADLVTQDQTGDHVLIKINQSWRTTWR